MIRPCLPRAGLFTAAALSVCSLFAQETARPFPPDLPSSWTDSDQFRRFWDHFVMRTTADDQEVRVENKTIATAIMNVPATAASLGNPALDGNVAGLPGTRWAAVGPAPINGGQIGRLSGPINGRPVSGRVTALAIDPTNSNRWLIGGAQGGVWETRNAGASWIARTDAQPSLAFGAIAFAPSAPQIIYAGTGEGNNAADSYAGSGLLKSVDGGLNWSLINSTNFAKATFTSIRVSPSDPNTLLAATNLGIAGYVNGRPLNAPATGILKSSDGGVTWTVKLAGVGTTVQPDPTNFNRQYGGLGNIRGATSNGVYRSTDAGETWALIDGPWNAGTFAINGVGRVEVAIAPSNPDIVYVSIQDAINGQGTDGGLLGLWVTSNGWDPTPLWTQIPTGATDDGTGTKGYCGWDFAFRSASNQCWYDQEIIVDPTNPNVIYAGGIPIWKYDGTTWTEISHTTATGGIGIHVDQHAFAFAGSLFVVGNDGGVWSTADGGVTWSDLNSTLQLTQFYEGDLAQDASLFLGGSQDNGSSDSGGATAWSFVFGGDGGGSAISPVNPSHLVASSQNSSFVGINGNSSFSANLGLTGQGTLFVGRIRECSNNENIFLTGTNALFSNNNFFSGFTGWTNNSTGTGVNFSSGILAQNFAPSDSTCNTYAFGSRSGSLWATTAGGGSSAANWVNIAALFTSLPPRGVSDIVFDPTNANIIYVVYSGFDGSTPATPGHIFQIVNWQPGTGAPSVTNISTPVDIPHNTIAVDPGNPNVLYIGTDVGVWKSTNAGASWAQMGPPTGMPNVAVFSLRVTPGGLIAFTHGRGAFLLATYDLNHDGVVNCADYNIVKASFGKSCGMPGFNPMADLSNDCTVDVRDINQMARNLPSACR